MRRIRIKPYIVFLGLWLLSIISFLFTAYSYKDSGLYNEAQSKTLVLEIAGGVLFFLLFIISLAVSTKLRFLRAFKINLNLAFIAVLLLVIIGLLVKNSSNNTNSSSTQPSFYLSSTPIEIITPSLEPSTSATSLNKNVQQTQDPVVNCGPGEHSKQYVKDKQSNCKNYVDCGLNGNTTWSLMLNTECNKKHTEENTFLQMNTTQTTQKSQGNNTYCYDNANGYSYYTSSGDQCNLNNAKSTTYKICQDTQKLKVNTCNSTCQTSENTDKAACSWAYTGAYAGIQNNTDLYGECLNGTDGVTARYGACLQKCSDQYTEDLKKCNL